MTLCELPQTESLITYEIITHLRSMRACCCSRQRDACTPGAASSERTWQARRALRVGRAHSRAKMFSLSAFFCSSPSSSRSAP